MSKIQLMSEILANKIAAGEVVEKTMNVVKELVENSIDAQSDEIKIELTDSGVVQIKISDNGIGMDENDACLAFSRHATSKLLDVEDLFNINSLGFRGEALPSIASVSHIILKTSDANTGTLVEIDGGKIKKVERSDLAKGTSITVSNLFYNTPVRLKYLKNLYTELANIVEYVNKMALSYPNIKFTLINNDKTLLETDGKGELLKVIYQIYGADTTKKMVKVEAANDDYEINGYISYPEIYKSNRNAITTLVNNRVIRNNELNKIITEAYHTYIPKDKIPIIVLNIMVDPILIDINIHPTKMDIKFSKMEELKRLIEEMIKKRLKQLLLIPKANVRTAQSVSEVTKPLINAYYKEEVDIPETTYEEVTFNLQTIEEEQLEYENEIEESQMEEKPRIKKMIPKGIVHMTYIIAENEDGMFIIDQHAAAERINYEKYLKAMSSEEKEVISPLIPISIDMAPSEYIIVKENKDLLANFGIDLEEFGSNTFIIRTHPTWLKEEYEKASLIKILELIAEKEEFSKEKFIEKTAITLACRMSIKANDYINLEEMQYLLDTLRNCENPFTCPHGRPTIITYTKYDLERLFKRAMD